MIAPVAGATDAAAVSWHTGLLTGTYIFAIFIFAPLGGRASDRVGRRPLILLGLAGFATAMTLFAFAESLPVIYVGRFLVGMFGAAMTPAAYAVVGDSGPSREWRSYRFALINVAVAAGFFTGPLLGGAWPERFRFRPFPVPLGAPFPSRSLPPPQSRFWQC